MIESFLTVGRQIITLYLLMAVGYVLGKLKLIDDHGAGQHEHAGDVYRQPLYAAGGLPASH